MKAEKFLEEHAPKKRAPEEEKRIKELAGAMLHGQLLRQLLTDKVIARLIAIVPELNQDKEIQSILDQMRILQAKILSFSGRSFDDHR